MTAVCNWFLEMSIAMQEEHILVPQDDLPESTSENSQVMTYTKTIVMEIHTSRFLRFNCSTCLPLRELIVV